MAKKQSYSELQRRIADLEAQQKQYLQSAREKELILDNANEIIAYHNVDNNLIWANRAYLSATDVPLSDLQREKVLHLRR